MPPEEAVSVAVDVCRALEAAHARGLIHRDIKPGNVMLLPDGRVKVVDFGIARTPGSDTLTWTGEVLGSTAYLAPEQASGQPVDERADLYALGCVLYEMLTGAVPFSAERPVATMYRHVNEDPPPPSSIRPVSAGLEAIVMRCLEKDPRRRFGSALELEHALVAARGDTTPLEVDPVAGTQPIATVAPVPVPIPGGTTPLEPVTTGASAEDLSRRRTAGTATHRRPDDRRAWLVAALGIGLALALLGVLIAANGDPLPSRGRVRQATPGAGSRGRVPPRTRSGRPGRTS